MTTRLILILTLTLAAGLSITVPPAFGQPPEAPAKPQGAGEAAKAPQVSLKPRFAPGQVALYEFVTSDSKLSPDPVRRTARLEVLRVTDKGTILRWTDYWEGKDKSVRPEPLGESEKRTAEFTVDVLVSHEVDDAKAADVEAARAELTGRFATEQRKLGKSAASQATAMKVYREILANEAMVHNTLLSDFGLLFNGLNLTLPANFKRNDSDEVSMDSALPALKRSVSFTLKGDDTGDRQTLRLKWTIPAEQMRPWMRSYMKRTLEATGEKPTDAQVTALTKDVKAIEGGNSSTYDRATGWPAALASDKQSADGAKVRRQTAHITLIEGPDPVVPPAPPAANSDEHTRWLVALLSSDKAPLRWYGRQEEDAIERVTPSQRDILLKEAGAKHAVYEREPSATTVFAGAATYDMPEEASAAVTAAYPGLPPAAKSAVLSNTLRIGKPWSLALFSRLLATSPDEKSLSSLPLDAIEDAPEVLNTALKASLEHTKAGNFDWRIVYASYELLDQKKLDAALRPAVFTRAAEVMGLTLTRAEPKQKPTHGQWVYAEDYEDDRDTIALSAEVLANGDGDTGLTELRRALKLTDQRPRAFAAGALVRRGEKVDPAVLESICASPVGWHALLLQLRSAGKTDLVPASAATLEAAATADMVNWLGHPQEIGREPEEIALLKFVDVPAAAEAGKEKKEAGAKDETNRYFVFKFRSDLEAFKDKGWMVGLSGPWSATSPFSQKRTRGHTFSEFEPVGTKTPEEHASAIIDMLTRAAKERAKNAPPSAPAEAPAPAPTR